MAVCFTLCLTKSVVHTVLSIFCGHVVKLFVCTKTCVMHCYKLLILTMTNLARVNENNENMTCKWNAFNSSVMSFPASASEFRGKWNALLIPGIFNSVANVNLLVALKPETHQADNRPLDSLARSVTRVCSVCPVPSSV